MNSNDRETVQGKFDYRFFLAVSADLTGYTPYPGLSEKL